MQMLKIFFLPMPSNIYYWWNFGSLLGMCLVIQIFSGIFLSMYYENDSMNTFYSVNNICRNVWLGWLIRSLHANGASLFFLFIYLHIGRGLYFQSFHKKYVWISGVIMLFMLMMIAFMGYILPWGQMSFWGATVITNLLSSLPYAGQFMTIWLWGNFSVSKTILMRFFSMHFLMPFLLAFMVIIHLIFLHKSSSSNPLGHSPNMDKIPFQPFFIYKDLMGMLFVWTTFSMMVMISPYLLMDPDNFISANPLVTPPHIQPEWYFLFAYAILRTIPNKLGGVVSLIMSISILLILPMMKNSKPMNLKYKIMFKFMFFTWLLNTIYLTVLGAMPIETPFTEMSKIFSILYFLFYSIYL